MTIRVLASGQSNMLGPGTGGPVASLIDSRVKVWNNGNPYATIGTAYVTPVYGSPPFAYAGAANLAVWFCDRLARHVADTVDMVMVARSATLIEDWITSDGDPAPMFEQMVSVWNAANSAPADVFLWHQGEGAVSGNHALYRSRFIELVGTLKTAGLIDNNTVIIVGGLAEANTNRINFNRGALQVLAAENAQISYASSNGLDTYDNTHFTGQSAYIFGSERYFGAWARAGISTMDKWALVNEGGTPGTAGSGTNKTVNIAPLLDEGFRFKGPPIIMLADQTYTPSAGTSAIYVEAQGPGGGGAGSTDSGGVARTAPGGGAGGYAARFIVGPEASYAVEVGGGGAGAASGSNNGSNGVKATRFGLVLVAQPGVGATAIGTTADPYIGNGGAGGSATGGDINETGGRGGFTHKFSATLRKSGEGGRSHFGEGGQYTISGNAAAVVNGVSGAAWGSGGAGGNSGTGGSASGGNGAQGVVIVREFVTG